MKNIFLILKNRVKFSSSLNNFFANVSKSLKQVSTRAFALNKSKSITCFAVSLFAAFCCSLSLFFFPRSLLCLFFIHRRRAWRFGLDLPKDPKIRTNDGRLLAAAATNFPPPAWVVAPTTLVWAAAGALVVGVPGTWLSTGGAVPIGSGLCCLFVHYHSWMGMGCSFLNIVYHYQCNTLKMIIYLWKYRRIYNIIINILLVYTLFI
jgi:hypothetical protein